MKSFRIVFKDGSVLTLKAAGYQLKFEASKPHHYEFQGEGNSGILATVMEAQVSGIVAEDSYQDYMPAKVS
jgi:hypothetical protein